MYVRYSKVHSKNQTFYGLRDQDLKQLEGHNSTICFIWNNQKEPLFIPFSDFEDVFDSLHPASDGQFKVQIFNQADGTELYIAQAGRYNVESYLGWDSLESLIQKDSITVFPDFSHSQIQTLVGSIGHTKGYDVWVPQIDRAKLDWQLTEKFSCKDDLPNRYDRVSSIIKEIDVIWLQRGSSDVRSLFEIEHSTPIYSGLLRLNDVFLLESTSKFKFNIVSNETRRSLFLKQINRPTFHLSGLSEICNFLEYKDVYGWFKKILKDKDYE